MNKQMITVLQDMALLVLFWIYDKSIGMEIMTFKGKKLNRKTKNKKFSILVAEKYE